MSNTSLLSFPGISEPAKPAQRSRGVTRRWRVLTTQVVIAVALVGFWEHAARNLIDPFWIGQPSAIAVRSWQLLQSGDLALHGFATVANALGGLAGAVLIGVPLGLALAANRFFADTVEPFLLGLYSLPRVALAPLFIMWLGIGEASKIVMALSMVVFIVILNTYEGVRGIEQELLDMMRAMRARRAQVLRRVVLPAIVPWIFAAVRSGIALALIGAVIGEFLGANRGLGWYIEFSAGRLDVIGVFTGLVVLMLVGMLLSDLARRAELYFSAHRR